MEHFINYGLQQVNLDLVSSMMQEFLDSHCVDSVSFSFTEYNPTDGPGLGTRTTIEKTSYEVEEFD